MGRCHCLADLAVGTKLKHPTPTVHRRKHLARQQCRFAFLAAAVALNIVPSPTRALLALSLLER